MHVSDRKLPTVHTCVTRSCPLCMSLIVSYRLCVNSLFRVSNTFTRSLIVLQFQALVLDLQTRTHRCSVIDFCVISSLVPYGHFSRPILSFCSSPFGRLFFVISYYDFPFKAVMFSKEVFHYKMEDIPCHSDVDILSARVFSCLHLCRA